MSFVIYPSYIELLTEIAEAAFIASRESIEKHQTSKRRKSGPNRQSMRPGIDTPLWNELRKRIQFHTSKHGAKAVLARELGLPRQRLHQFLREGSAMPDAERTLLLLGWLIQQEKASE